MTEETLATFGLRGKRVRVSAMCTANGTALVRADWREGGKRIRESWPDTRENRRTAKAYAEGVAARLAERGAAPVRERITLGTLLHRYRLANDQWRPATLSSRLYRLGKFLHFAGETTYADAVTSEMLDEFRAEMKRIIRKKTGAAMVPTQVARCASEVLGLFRFARQRKLIAENPLDGYEIKRGKDDRPESREEYTQDEWGRILAQMDPEKAREWRAYCLFLLAGLLGPRQKALRHLTWDDVDLTTREVTWRAVFAKTGKEWTQPLPDDAVRAFAIAARWREHLGYTGRWVFPGAYAAKRKKDEPYTYQALNYRLHEAEKTAKVGRKDRRAMHGFRRGAAGNVLELTGGNLKDAGDWIGDTDLKSLQKYLKKRDPKQREVAAMVKAPADSRTKKPTNGQQRDSGDEATLEVTP